MTAPEVLLWSALRGRALDGLRFRRQHPFGRYTLDFYCESVRLAVEIDGWGHNMGDRPERDEARDRWLEGRGVRVLRIAASEVMRDLDTALHGVLAAAHDSPLRPFGPLPPAGEE